MPNLKDSKSKKLVKSDFDFRRGLVVFQERQDSFVVKFVRVNRIHDLLVPFDKLLVLHFGNEVH